jgi:hypothetical protein
MGRIQRWQRLAVATSKHHLYAPQFHSVLIDLFRSPPQYQPTLPLNRHISIHRQTTCKSFSSSALCIAPIQPPFRQVDVNPLQKSSISRKMPGRTMALHGALSDDRTDGPR